MTIPSTGPITMAMVAAELGISRPISLGDSRVRALAGKASGPVSMADLRGKSAGAPAPQPTALTVQTTDGYAYGSSNGGTGTASCPVRATISGGVGTVTSLWEFVSNPGQFVLSGSNIPNATVSKTFSRYSSGSAKAVLRHTARDSAGAVVVSEPVYAELEWVGSAVGPQ